MSFSSFFNLFTSLLESQDDINEYNESTESNKKHMYEWNEISYSHVMYLNSVNDNDYGKVLNFKSQEIENFNSNFELLGKYYAFKYILG